MGREALVKPQPLPVVGKMLVKTEVPHYMDIDYAIKRDCIYKMEASEAKYGSPLMTHNGRNSRLDAYQDLIDVINYTIQTHLEETNVEESEDLLVTIIRLNRLARRIRYKLEEQGVLDRE